MAFTINTRGSCIPSDGETIELFKNIQREANRMLAFANRDLLRVDGKIGKKTLAAVNSILGLSATTCSQIAKPSIMTALATKANSAGAPVVQDPVFIVRDFIDPPPKVDPTTGEVKSGLATAGFAGIPLWVLLAVGAGGYIVYKRGAGKKPGKKKRKPASKGKVKAENLLGSF